MARLGGGSGRRGEGAEGLGECRRVVGDGAGRLLLRAPLALPLGCLSAGHARAYRHERACTPPPTHPLSLPLFLSLSATLATTHTLTPELHPSHPSK